jgi:hypothetical protein
VRELTPSRARAIATTAYIFAYPLVTRYQDMYRQAIDVSSPAYTGGFGTWRHVVSHERRKNGSGRPKEAVLYSSIWLDLRAEPWCCTMSDVPSGAVCTGRWVDLWGFLLESDRTLQMQPVSSFLASAPKGDHHAPPDIDGIVRGESEFAALLTETRWRDPYTLPNLEPIQPEIVLKPASLHSGHRPPQLAPAVNWWACDDDVETTDEFWSCANFALTLTTPNPQDETILERIAEIGISAGRRWDASTFPDEVADAIHRGVDDALSDLMEAATQWTDHDPNHLRREAMDSNYFRRAIGALRRISMG